MIIQYISMSVIESVLCVGHLNFEFDQSAYRALFPSPAFAGTLFDSVIRCVDSHSIASHSVSAPPTNSSHGYTTGPKYVCSKVSVTVIMLHL